MAAARRGLVGLASQITSPSSTQMRDPSSDVSLDVWDLELPGEDALADGILGATFRLPSPDTIPALHALVSRAEDPVVLGSRSPLLETALVAEKTGLLDRTIYKPGISEESYTSSGTTSNCSGVNSLCVEILGKCSSRRLDFLSDADRNELHLVLQNIQDLGYKSESLCVELETCSERRDLSRWMIMYASIIHAIDLAASLIEDNLSIYSKTVTTDKTVSNNSNDDTGRDEQGRFCKEPGRLVEGARVTKAFILRAYNP